MSGVEFFDEGTHDDTAAPRPEPHRAWRRWWLLGIVACAAAATGWVLTRPVDHAASTLPRTALTRGPLATASPTDNRAQKCHGAPFCASTPQIPPPLQAAIRHYLPDTNALDVRSYFAHSLTTGASYLAERDIRANAGSVSVLILVRRDYGDPSAPHEIIDAPLGTGSLVVHGEPVGFVVDLQYLAPETVPPTLSRLRMLIRDPRLESV